MSEFDRSHLAAEHSNDNSPWLHPDREHPQYEAGNPNLPPDIKTKDASKDSEVIRLMATEIQPMIDQMETFPADAVNGKVNWSNSHLEAAQKIAKTIFQKLEFPAVREWAVREIEKAGVNPVVMEAFKNVVRKNLERLRPVN